MSLPIAIAMYVTIWFVALFAVLPFGVTSLHENGDVSGGVDPGAPEAPRLVTKAFWTTLVSIPVFAIVYYLAQRYA